MKRLFSLFLLGYIFLLHVQAKHYAVLVAGSNFFYNYRHQADVFHAYQLLTANGYDPDNIITFAYDDIANDPSNPFPGQIFNKPSSGPGKDVYKGVVIDYSGKDVTPRSFLDALKGDTEAAQGKKVLQSTQEDNIFIYFSDHGGTGLIAFPGEGYLYADELIKALKFMAENKRFKEMVIYIEACESGSMLDGILPDNIHVYTTTAANPDESSYATYCYPDDKVNGKSVGSCLGDEYSVHFLENLESVNPTKETLAEQYKAVKEKTKMSHVMRYGNFTISQQAVGNFQADKHSSILSFEEEQPRKTSTVDSRYVKLHYLQNRFSKLNDQSTMQEMLDEMKSVQTFDRIFRQIKDKFNLDVERSVKNINFECLRKRVSIYEKVCSRFTDYGLKYVRYLHFSCSQNVDIDEFEESIIDLCLREQLLVS